MTGWLMALYNNMTAEERERWAYAQGNVFLARMVAQTYDQVDDYAPMPFSGYATAPLFDEPMRAISHGTPWGCGKDNHE